MESRRSLWSEVSFSEENKLNNTEEFDVSIVEAPPLIDNPEPEDSQTDFPDLPVHSNAPVLTIRNCEDVTTEEEREDIIWHEIRNAYRTRRILTGKMDAFVLSFYFLIMYMVPWQFCPKYFPLYQ